MTADAVAVEVDGRTLQLTNLDKVLYPATRTTKAEVVDYYARIAPVMLPHVAGRCVTLRRFPDGVDGPDFFQKRCPDHRPDWLPVAGGPGDRGGRIDYCLVDETAALVWCANLAALEIHLPMALSDDLDAPTMLVFDLDPGEPAGIAECAQVALDIRDVLEALELIGRVKTSGSKGLQLYVPLNRPHEHEHASRFALAVGQLLERRGAQVVTTMNRSARSGKVLVDWSQNSRHKTTIGVYSMRARSEPTVSTPLTWDEVRAVADGGHCRFTIETVLDRVDAMGDVFADVLTRRQELPSPSGP